MSLGGGTRAEVGKHSQSVSYSTLHTYEYQLFAVACLLCLSGIMPFDYQGVSNPVRWAYHNPVAIGTAINFPGGGDRVYSYSVECLDACG